MKSIIDWVLRIIPALILLQTLFYKFSGAPESVYIFTMLGIEPWGRIGIGIAELIAGILILVPRTTLLGSLGAMGLMGGALFSHVTILGIEVNKDGGTLFMLALVVVITSVINLIRNKQYLMSFIIALIGKKA